MPAGRPTKYKPEFAEQAHKLTLLGADDPRLANFFEVDEATIHRWKAKHEEFCEAIKDGKDIADGDIAKSLYHRAMGYSHPDTKFFTEKDEEGNLTVVEHEYTKHYPPDATAIAYWLNNRVKLKWTNKQASSPVNFEFPENATPHEQAQCILNAVSKGDIPPDVGSNLINSIKNVIDIEEITTLKARIEHLEKLTNLE